MGTSKRTCQSNSAIEALALTVIRYMCPVLRFFRQADVQYVLKIYHSIIFLTFELKKLLLSIIKCSFELTQHLILRFKSWHELIHWQNHIKIHCFCFVLKCHVMSQYTRKAIINLSLLHIANVTW